MDGEQLFKRIVMDDAAETFQQSQRDIGKAMLGLHSVVYDMVDKFVDNHTEELTGGT